MKTTAPKITKTKFFGILVIAVIVIAVCREKYRDDETNTFSNKGHELFEYKKNATKDESFDELLASVKAGDQGTKKRIFESEEKKARSGDAKAQALIGRLYYIGGKCGLTEDIERAAEWSRKSALQGNLDAAITLYGIYSGCSDSDPKWENKDEAAKWLKVAADGGLPFAQGFLGLDTLFGWNGQTKDQPKAFSYLEKAAKAGDLDSTYWLGECYANSWGVNQDAHSAIRFLSLAADSNKSFTYRATAQRKLADAYQYGYGVGKNSKKAFEYYLKSGFLGDDISQMALAQAYCLGRGVVPSKGMSLVWIYVNRACGGKFTDETLSIFENSFKRDELLAIQQKAREIVLEIEQNSQGKSSFSLPQPQRKSVCSGTGVVISSEGLVVTAAHVVQDSRKIEINLPDGAKAATIVDIDSKNDLAVLRVSGSVKCSAPLAPSRDVKLGQSVFAIGFPNTEIQGSSPKLTKGEISSLSGIRDEPTQWQISVPVQSGNSGSPLFDESGNVVGIVVSKLNALETAKATGDLAQNVNYAVKNAYLIPMLEKFPDKLSKPKSKTMFKTFESVVEEARQSVVLILAY